MAAAIVRQIICRFVRFNTTLFFTFVKSFGTDTNAIHLPMIGNNTGQGCVHFRHLSFL